MGKVVRFLLSVFFKCSRTKWNLRWYIISTPWFGVKVHNILEEDEWHTHPWHGFSIVFGTYQEQYELGVPYRNVRWFNRIGAYRPHRTRSLNTKGTLTIFFHGPRVNEDWYWGGDKAPWRGVQTGGDPRIEANV